MRRSRLARLSAPFAFAHLLPAVNAQSVTATGQEPSQVATTATTATSASITSTPSVSANSTSAAPKVHTVRVGDGGFTMDPAELTDVNVGDTVTL